MSKIYYTKPYITQLEVDYATDAALNGWGDKCYDYIYKFEDSFKKHLNVSYAMATSSCTGAMHMGLSALGISHGDEVIIADINWIASAAPIVYLGATPIFIDILNDTWCIDPSKIEQAITPKTKAIIAVHLYGNLCDMDAIMAIAKKHNLYVIEDAAEAIGSIYKGKKAGSIGDFGVFSFHGTKTMTTGEGGMFVTNNLELYKKVNILNSHGRNPENPKQFWAETIGFKYKISNIQAAIGYAQMTHIDELINRKREIYFKYFSLFKNVEKVSMNPNPTSNELVYGYWMPTLIFDAELEFDRDLLIDKFKEINVDARVFFYPLSMLPMFDEVRNNKVSLNIYARGINLPSYHEISDGQIKKVADIVVEYLS
ncbi:glutamine--scyllo-inositol aminotransferase [Marinomonas sp. UCMA 3892]|uniref:DegT/DnrJ/EryC1/StrS family aminotransferase n=1 Tax=Marinomonas sp. UCMA 3892 TaxID=1972585 RepID=UPI00146D0F03|nr:DegT/DnrJ/EryC1/StrS family aminotransferase [Marinomonas sp. UCMA 3892]NLU96918.1 glutamine--scyllo-inositol aminotransferase [Marinomonas sp. UCMA 3892]